MEVVLHDRRGDDFRIAVIHFSQLLLGKKNSVIVTGGVELVYNMPFAGGLLRFAYHIKIV